MASMDYSGELNREEHGQGGGWRRGCGRVERLERWLHKLDTSLMTFFLLVHFHLHTITKFINSNHAFYCFGLEF